MAKLPGDITRKQHWIPQFYLRRFADSTGQLQVYRIEGDRFFVTGTENVCAKRDLYEVEYTERTDSDPDRFYAQNLIEKQLSKIEDRLAPLYAQLLDCVGRGEFRGKQFDDGRLVACLLAAHLIVRYPKVLHDELEMAPELLLRFQSSLPFTEDEVALLEATDWRGDYLALTKLAIQEALLFSNDERVPFTRIYEALAKGRFSVFEAALGARFVTTSMPLFIVGPDDDSYDFNIAYMPLSDTYAAIISNSGSFPAYGKLDFLQTMFLNRLLLLNNHHWNEAMTSVKGSLELAVRDWKYSSECD